MARYFRLLLINKQKRVDSATRGGHGWAGRLQGDGTRSSLNLPPDLDGVASFMARSFVSTPRNERASCSALAHALGGVGGSGAWATGLID